MIKTKTLFDQLHEANEKLKDSEENYKHYVDKCFALEDKLRSKDEMLEEMVEALLLLRSEYSENGPLTGYLYDIANKPLTKYENSK